MKQSKADKLNKEWGEKYGAASFDFKNRNIILYDGGLFSVEKKKVMLQKFKGIRKKGNIDGHIIREVIFTKKKYPHETYEATLWFEEIDSTISFFVSMRRFLKKQGYRTGYAKINMKRDE
jgi:hypothetical protein